MGEVQTLIYLKQQPKTPQYTGCSIKKTGNKKPKNVATDILIKYRRTGKIKFR